MDHQKKAYSIDITPVFGILEQISLYTANNAKSEKKLYLMNHRYLRSLLLAAIVLLIIKPLGGVLICG